MYKVHVHSATFANARQICHNARFALRPGLHMVPTLEKELVLEYRESGLDPDLRKYKFLNCSYPPVVIIIGLSAFYH